ncbi:unnamed protein product [Calicophoron daubneyi]|uniref:Uncharacterized protein n=1 Tax=Calicophoron daubneyi TaxID=300641 RepID=A0AAV2TQQ0_CALDB
MPRGAAELERLASEEAAAVRPNLEPITTAANIIRQIIAQDATLTDREFYAELSEICTEIPGTNLKNPT